MFVVDTIGDYRLNKWFIKRDKKISKEFDVLDYLYVK